MVDGPQNWPLLPQGGAPQTPQPPPVRHEPPGRSPSDPLRIVATWSNESRRGRWSVPPYVTAVPTMSNVLLDLRDAVPESDVIRLTVEGVAGRVVLIVPDGWGIDTDRLGKGIGSIRNRIGPIAVQGNPLVVVTGSVGLGTFVARRERWYEKWGRPAITRRELLR